MDFARHSPQLGRYRTGGAIEVHPSSFGGQLAECLGREPGDTTEPGHLSSGSTPERIGETYMKVFLLLQAVLLMPYFMVGVVWPFVLLDPESRSYARDLQQFTLWTGVGVAIWLPVAVAGRILSLRTPAMDVSESAPWTVVFPATTRLFAIGAPAAFSSGIAVGCVLHVLG